MIVDGLDDNDENVERFSSLGLGNIFGKDEGRGRSCGCLILTISEIRKGTTVR